MTENLYATNCIRTRSGKYFDFTNIRQEDIDIEDIAHALSHINRFVGHLPQPYNVAQHSVLCSQIVPRQHAYAALLHDASEAYTGDCNYFLKRLLPQFQEVEHQIMEALALKFDFQYPLWPEIKAADKEMLEVEWDVLMLELSPARELHTLVLDVWTPHRSRAEFMNAFYNLKPLCL